MVELTTDLVVRKAFDRQLLISNIESFAYFND